MDKIDKNEQEFKKDYVILKKYLKTQKITDELRVKILKYLSISHKVSYHDKEIKRILNQIPTHLQIELNDQNNFQIIN